MLKKIILILIALFLLTETHAQDSLKRKSVYRYKLGLDIPIGLISLGTGASSLILHKKKSALSCAAVKELNANDINVFDRGAVYQHSKAAAIASDVFQYTAMASPALLFIDKNIRKDWATVMPIWAETAALTTALTLFTKELSHRNRPYVYTEEFKNNCNGTDASKNATSSFFSGHTSITAASTFFIAMVYSDYHPDSRWKPLIWTGAAILPALTAITRYKAGKHYWTDVITGYAVGALVGTLTPYLHRREFRRK